MSALDQGSASTGRADFGVVFLQHFFAKVLQRQLLWSLASGGTDRCVTPTLAKPCRCTCPYSAPCLPPLVPRARPDRPPRPFCLGPGLQICRRVVEPVEFDKHLQRLHAMIRKMLRQGKMTAVNAIRQVRTGGGGGGGGLRASAGGGGGVLLKERPWVGGWVRGQKKKFGYLKPASFSGPFDKFHFVPEEA